MIGEGCSVRAPPLDLLGNRQLNSAHYTRHLLVNIKGALLFIFVIFYVFLSTLGSSGFFLTTLSLHYVIIP
jgi:hypothetical protein